MNSPLDPVLPPSSTPASVPNEPACPVSLTPERMAARYPRLLPTCLALALLLAVSRLLWMGPSGMLAQQPWLWLADTVFLLLLLLPLVQVYFIRPLCQYVQHAADIQATLQDQAGRLQGVLDSAFDGIIVIHPSGRIVEFNPAAETIFALPRAEALGQNISILMPPADGQAHAGYVAGYLHTGKRKIIGKGRELQGVRKNGDTFPMELAVTEMHFRGELHFVGTVRDITRRRQAEEGLLQAKRELEQRVQERTAQLAEINAALSAEIEERKRIAARLKALATTDGLTGILNRREFDRLLQLEFERAQRYDSALALILFDIDFFKSVNDRYGHSAGDSVLVEMARLVAASIRAHDLFGRWGGEEFILLVPGSDAVGAVALAEKLRQIIAMHAFSVPVPITCSFGVADCSGHGSAAAMLEAADHLLYAAKDGSRNRVNGPVQLEVTEALACDSPTQ